ncbi:MAG: hypothetical protein EOO51_09180 [Flavobacterium sp.]|nr:MAG: hypothetical protein EOO51_09180 [Flavobacterium sp.]
MESHSNINYSKHFAKGYSLGLDPNYGSVEDIDKVSKHIRRQYAFVEGFSLGRREYELINSPIGNGIPETILTFKDLNEIKLEAGLGMQLMALGYNEYQLLHIERWFNAGLNEYDIESGILLGRMLARYDIRL